MVTSSVELVAASECEAYDVEQTLVVADLARRTAQRAPVTMTRMAR